MSRGGLILRAEMAYFNDETQLVNTNGFHPVEAGGVIDQHRRPSASTALFAVFQDTPEALGDPGDGEVLADDSLQCPPQPAAGELRPWFVRLGGILPPHVPATGAPLAADSHQPRGRPPAEGLMAELPSYRVPRDALVATLATPLISSHRKASTNGPIRSKELPCRFQTKPIKAAKSSQGRAGH